MAGDSFPQLIVLFSEQEQEQLPGALEELAAKSRALEISLYSYDKQYKSLSHDSFLNDGRDQPVKISASKLPLQAGVEALGAVYQTIHRLDIAASNKAKLIARLVNGSMFDLTRQGLAHLLNHSDDESVLTMCRQFIALRMLQAKFKTFDEAVAKAPWFGLHASEKKIKKQVAEIQHLLAGLPTGRSVEVPQYDNILCEIQTFLTRYEDNEFGLHNPMMAQEARDVITDTCLLSDSNYVERLDLLCQKLAACVSEWVRVSSLPIANAGHRRQTLPTDDPLFDFIVRTIEKARCPLALSQQEGDANTGYDKKYLPRKPSDLRLLDVAAATELLRCSRQEEAPPVDVRLSNAGSLGGEDDFIPEPAILSPVSADDQSRPRSGTFVARSPSLSLSPMSAGNASVRSPLTVGDRLQSPGGGRLLPGAPAAAAEPASPARYSPEQLRDVDITPGRPDENIGLQRTILARESIERKRERAKLAQQEQQLVEDVKNSPRYSSQGDGSGIEDDNVVKRLNFGGAPATSDSPRHSSSTEDGSLQGRDQSEEYLTVGLNEEAAQQSAVVRVLTTSGRRKASSLIKQKEENLSDFYERLIRDLKDYARLGRANAQVAMDVFAELEQIHGDDNNITQHDVEEACGLAAGGLTIGFGQVRPVNRDFARQLDRPEYYKKLYRLAKTVAALKTARPTGYQSRCQAIIDHALIQLEPFILVEADFCSVPAITLQDAEQELAQIINASPIQPYLKNHLDRLVTQAKAVEPVMGRNGMQVGPKQRKVLAVGLNRVLTNWQFKYGAKPEVIEGGVLARLLRLNEQLGQLTARGHTNGSAVDQATMNRVDAFIAESDRLVFLSSVDAAITPSFAQDEMNEAADAAELAIDQVGDYYAERYLTNSEHSDLKGLVGDQAFIRTKQNTIIIESHYSEGSSRDQLTILKEKILDQCQRASFAGYQEAMKLERWLLDLFDDKKAPSLTAQVNFIRQDSRFNSISLNMLCRLRSHAEGISLLGLYRALKLEKFLVEDTVYADAGSSDPSFPSLPETLREYLQQERGQLTERLPKETKIFPSVMTYKKLVDEIIDKFGPFHDAFEAPFKADYPQLSRAVLSAVLSVENNAELANHAKKVVALCSMLLDLVVPYLEKHGSYNPAIQSILALVELTARPLSFSEANLHRYPGIKTLRQKLDNAYFYGHRVSDRISLDVLTISPNQAADIVSKTRNKEAALDDKLDACIDESLPPLSFDEIDFSLSLQQPVAPPNEGFDEVLIANDVNDFVCQVISHEGERRLKNIERKAESWESEIFKSCRAYYAQSNVDFITSSPHWREYAAGLEQALRDALSNFDQSKTIREFSGLAQLDLDDLDDGRKTALSKSIIVLQYIEKTLKLIGEDKKNWIKSSGFRDRLLAVKEKITRNMLGKAHYRQVKAPNWSGAIAQLSDVFVSMEKQFDVGHSNVNDPQAYQERFAETADLRFQLLSGLKAIEENEPENDADRFEALSTLLIKIIKDAKSAPLSIFNRQMVDSLVVLYEQITRAFSRGDTRNFEDVALRIESKARLAVPKLEPGESRQLIAKLDKSLRLRNSKQTVSRFLGKPFSFADFVFKESGGVQKVDWMSSSRGDWLAEQKLAFNPKASLPVGDAGQSEEAGKLYFDKRAAVLKKDWVSEKVDAILDGLARKSHAYARVDTGLFKSKRFFRSLALKVAQQCEQVRTLDFNSTDNVDLINGRPGYAALLNDVGDAEKTGLAKLLSAEAMINAAIKERKVTRIRSASEYEGILKQALKEVRAHLPRMKEADASYKDADAVKKAVISVLGNVALNDDFTNIRLMFSPADWESSNKCLTASALCHQVADELVKQIDRKYTYSMFASRSNPVLNDPRTLALFKIIEAVDHPIARGNPGVSVGRFKEAPYLNFDAKSKGYLFKRLKAKLGPDVINGAAQAEEMSRVQAYHQAVAAR